MGAGNGLGSNGRQGSGAFVLAPRDRTPRTGGFAAARIVAGETRSLIGSDLEDGDNRLVCSISGGVV